MSTSIPYQQSPYTAGSSSSAIQCYRCGDTCKGEVVRVQSNHFHIRCFTCQVCGCDLAQSGFFFKNQEYICTHDYQQLYGTRCDSCGDFITGEVISALGRTYHPKCFVCSTCRKPFPIGDKVTFSGKDCVCQNCSHALLSTKPIKIHGPSHCAGCKEEIKQGQSLLALEKQWHVSCFKCQTCGVILTGEYISKDGIPYCESDYHAQFGIKCETCDRYISGRVLEAGGKHYHPTCARCVRCHQMFTEGEEMYLTGSEVWHPICKQAARAEKKLKHRRTSETSISPPGSSIGSPNRVICDIYESFDTRQRRASSPGYIDSPTYSRQGMSPTIPRSPHHFYRSAAGESNIYRKPPIYKRHATKSKTSEDIAQSSKYSPAYSPDPYYHSESEYWSFQGSPKAPRARRFSSGGEEDGYDRGMHKVSASPAGHSQHQTWLRGQGSAQLCHPRRCHHHLCCPRPSVPSWPAPAGALKEGDSIPLLRHPQPSSSPSGAAQPVPGDAVPFCGGPERVGQGQEKCKVAFSPRQIQSGIGRLILREEMKARSNSYADPWTPPRSSASSREALHTAGYEGSLNGYPLISKSASLPAYRRNGLHRPPSAELFHYDSTNAVNWGVRETPVPGGILPDLRDDHGRVRPPGAVEEERAEEAGPAVLSAVHYKYIHTYKYIHREISIWQLCMILGAVRATGALPAPLRVNWSLADRLVLCVSFHFQPDFSIDPRVVPTLGVCHCCPSGTPGEIFLLQPRCWGWQRAGFGMGAALGCPIPF
uniref:Actin binding LIM protein family member 3 n=1 Tax=Taeniopygia guttata TaxID=59729 RepID=A0A674GHI1_TAEGU